jgi:cytochrome P450
VDLAAPPSGSGLRAVPGDGGAPLIGQSLKLLRQGAGFPLGRYQRYGSVSWARTFGQRTVSALGPEAAEVVLTNKDKAFSQDGWDFFVGPFFRRGLMLLDFEEHLFHRRMMQHAFTNDRLAGYIHHIGEVARSSVSGWSAGDGFLLYPALKRLTLDIATRVFMATELGPEATTTLRRAFVAAVRAGTSIVRHPVPGGRWRAGLRGRQVLEEYFRKSLPLKRAGNDDDLFSALCHADIDDGTTFTDDDVINHMIFLMMAAHDTSTIATTTAAYYLGKHPQWQQRAREESMALPDGPLDRVGLDSLRTLDLVIKESLRLVPPVPALARKAVRDTEILGYYIPAGTMVTVSIWANHLLPDYWTNPQDFDPERFSELRREDKSHRYAWMPFGGGVHKCIGMHFGMLEIKTLLHEMLRCHTWSAAPGYEVAWDATALPVPRHGLPTDFHRLAS